MGKINSEKTWWCTHSPYMEVPTVVTSPVLTFLHLTIHLDNLKTRYAEEKRKYEKNYELCNRVDPAEIFLRSVLFPNSQLNMHKTLTERILFAMFQFIWCHKSVAMVTMELPTVVP